MKLQGVVTTGIYCRASCSARPKPEHVRPLRNAAEALASGFRPCLLCRPDRLPNLGFAQPVVEVAHALRLIADGYLDHATTDALAERIGYSTRQLVRLFEQHVGASPDFVARARRAHLARRLLDETNLSITRVGFAAGFSSARQMNRVMRAMFGFSPSELRAKRKAGDTLEPLDGGLRLRVPVRGPLATNRLIEYLGARAIPGIESVEDGSYRRTINTCGYPGVVEVAPGDRAQHLCVTLHLATFGSIIDDVDRVRALFATQVDGATARRALGRDPLLRPVVQSLHGVRLPGAWDRFETAVRIIVGQQVSVAAASTTTGKLVAKLGHPIDSPLPYGLRMLFPSPAVVANARPSLLDMPRARARAIIAFSKAVDSGELDLSSTAPLDETLASLQRVEGIGPWTANMIAARVFGQADAFPASDLGLRRATASLLGRTQPLSTRELETLAERWRPHRTMAAALLWMSETWPSSPPSSKHP